MPLQNRVTPWGGITALPADTAMQVLTPRSVVKALARGCRPVLHGSASGKTKA